MNTKEKQTPHYTRKKTHSSQREKFFPQRQHLLRIKLTNDQLILSWNIFSSSSLFQRNKSFYLSLSLSLSHTDDIILLVFF